MVPYVVITFTLSQHNIRITMSMCVHYPPITLVNLNLDCNKSGVPFNFRHVLRNSLATIVLKTAMKLKMEESRTEKALSLDDYILNG